MKYLIIIIILFNNTSFASGKLDAITDNLYSLLNSNSIMDDFNGVILIADNDSIFFCHSNGFADFEHEISIDEYSTFNIASLTKQFTAVAILLLEENGLLSTNDTISKYLPDYKYSDQITIHQLLTHSSGIPNYNSFEDYRDFSKKELTNDEVIEWIEKYELNFSPGSDFEYSNSGYFILNSIIESISGESYRTFLMDNIFKKANMRGTDNYASKDIIPNHASRYIKVDDQIKKPDWFNNSFKMGSGSIFSTSDDLFNWYKNLRSYKIISDSSFSKMFTDHYDGYGYGIGKGDSERLFFEHEGKIPGINAYSAFFINPDYYFLIWSNLSNEEFWELRDELRNYLINLEEGNSES